MGMTKAKSLVQVKDGLTFLDLIAHQATNFFKAGDIVPLLLMNSFRTREDSLAVLEKLPTVAGDLPLDFVQNKEPQAGRGGRWTRSSWEADPDLEWCPARAWRHLSGPGGLGAAGSSCWRAGYETAFVSNADNLGATLDPRILSWFRSRGAAVPDGGLATGARTTARVATWRAAGPTGSWCYGSRPDGGRETRTPSRTSPGTSSSTPTRCGSTCRALAKQLADGGRGARAADDRQPQDRRSHRLLVTRGDPARDRDGGGDRRVRGRRRVARAALALRAGQDDQRPALAAV